MMRKWYILSVFSCVLYCSVAQIVSPDSGQVLSYDEYIQLVIENHPKMIGIDILNENSDAIELMARGGFDPKLKSELSQKKFDDKDYYSNWYSELKVPTRIGADVKISYENNDGIFLNSADNVPVNGLMSVGVDLPLGAGLLYDERRRILDEAELIRSLNDQEIIIQINELLAEASSQYIKWQYSYTLYQQILEIYLVSDIRWRNARIQSSTGEIPAIDTLELGINRTQWLQSLLEAQQKLQGERFKINNYLWDSEIQPLDLQQDAVPDSLDIQLWDPQISEIQEDINNLLIRHPEILQLQTEGQMLEIDRRLEREFLKPELNLSYHPLYSINEEYRNSDWLIEDYKFSANFAYPILNRKTRGKIDLLDQKIMKNEIDQSLLRQKIYNALLAEINRIDILQEEIILLRENVAASLTLLEAEEYKFSIGESSAFLVNSRETKFFESILKNLKKQYELLDTKIYLMELSRQGLER